MPSNTLAPTLALLLASSAMPAYAADPAPAPRVSPSPSPSSSAQMAQLLAAARMWDAKNRADMARGILESFCRSTPHSQAAHDMNGLASWLSAWIDGAEQESQS